MTWEFAGRIRDNPIATHTRLTYQGKNTYVQRPDGTTWWGSDLGDPEQANQDKPTTTFLGIYTSTRIFNGETFDPGDILFGTNQTSYANMLWDASAGELIFRTGTTQVIRIASTGQVRVGTNAVGAGLFNVRNAVGALGVELLTQYTGAAATSAAINISSAHAFTNVALQLDASGSSVANYALYITSPVAGTENYAIISTALAQSVHAGSVRIGSAVQPTKTLDVTGTLGVSGAVTLAGLTASRFVKTDASSVLTASGGSTVSLTTEVSGILPVANGGTNNSTAYTAGSVIFSDGSKLTQDNANLFWDDTNNRLGIGTASPNAPLDVFSTSGMRVGGSLTKYINLFTSGAGNDIGTVGGTLFIEFDRSNPVDILNGYLAVQTDGNTKLNSNLIFTDNTYDIGASGATRPRNVYASGIGLFGGKLTSAGRLEAAHSGTAHAGGNFFGRDAVNISTAAVTIKASTGPYGSLYVVSGRKTTAPNEFFSDIVHMLANSGGGGGGVNVLNSLTDGAADARTYTRSGENLQLSMAANTYTVYVTGIGGDES